MHLPNGKQYKTQTISVLLCIWSCPAGLLSGWGVITLVTLDVLGSHFPWVRYIVSLLLLARNLSQSPLKLSAQVSVNPHNSASCCQCPHCRLPHLNGMMPAQATLDSSASTKPKDTRQDSGLHHMISIEQQRGQCTMLQMLDHVSMPSVIAQLPF